METTLDRLNEGVGAAAQPRTVGRVVHTGSDPASDPRREIPVLGFSDYWYPLLGQRQVPRGKPRMVKLLGQELCVFHGQRGIAAVSNFCPHRGTRLSRGNCHYAGTVTCPYHGFTYDERGECVAVLPEGPESRMPGKLQVRRYPTRTLKGIVFVWMGEGEPTDPRQDLPPELFDESFVQHDATIWHTNWRPALENFQDVHAPYVHRNALQMLINPIVKRSFQGARPVIRGGGVALDRYSDGKRANAPYQEYFPGVDGYWPKHRWRLLWTWIFGSGRTRQRPHDTAGMKAYHASPEWTNGPHMPGMQRIDHATWIYTRWCVPIDENTTREFYLHATRPAGELARLRQRLTFPIRHRWLAYRNFGLQDGAVLADTPYDRPERFSQTDVETIGWRTLAILSARHGGRHDAIPLAVIEKVNARAAPDGELASLA
jgi:phenylpropionate dioxygenase-like ring-hydroxylating dioxygenase large terminal subunit